MPTTTNLCACGRPLHYADDGVRRMVERLIEGAGGDPMVKVHIGRRTWLVQRHYIALHGITAIDLAAGRVPNATEITRRP